jgi:hypothetical protein
MHIYVTLLQLGTPYATLVGSWTEHGRSIIRWAASLSTARSQLCLATSKTAFASSTRALGLRHATKFTEMLAHD